MWVKGGVNSIRGITEHHNHHVFPLCLQLPGYKHYGLNRGEQNGQQGLFYREWAPGAKVGWLTSKVMALTRLCGLACNKRWQFCLGTNLQDYS